MGAIKSASNKLRQLPPENKKRFLMDFADKSLYSIRMNVKGANPAK